MCRPPRANPDGRCERFIDTSMISSWHSNRREMLFRSFLICYNGNDIATQARRPAEQIERACHAAI
jgi:hypothetical protein